MGRWACVDVPALPLQLLLRREPAWAAGPACPVCVVEQDAPQARVVWVNEAARAAGILPGQRYAAALGLTRDLRAGVVPQDEMAQGVAAIAARLRDFTPDVEPAQDDPGVFWLDGDGLGRLFESASAWARALHGALTELGFLARVVVGFTRYGTYAVARALGATDRPVVVFRDPAGENAAARDVPLPRLGFPPELRDDLGKLGVRTLGEFLDLPEGGLHERFGDEAAQVHRFASGRGHAPLMPVVPDEPVAATWELGYPDGDRERLLQYIARLIELLTSQLAARHTHAGAVRLAFVLETRAAYEEVIRPAHPTREVAQLLELVRLRLEYRALPARVEEIALELVPAAADVRQTQLIDRPRRDAEAADRALARLRAEFGTVNVVRARLREGHLPEASFLWEPLGTPLEQPDRAPAATPRGNGPFAAPRTAGPSKGPVGLLVRRLFEHPLALPPRPHHLRDDGWLIHGYGDGAVRRLVGPYVVSGGWWMRPAGSDPVQREYHFAETARGDLLWAYYDPQRRRWFLQGQVE